jgi:hypothetical protein
MSPKKATADNNAINAKITIETPSNYCGRASIATRIVDGAKFTPPLNSLAIGL